MGTRKVPIRGDLSFTLPRRGLAALVLHCLKTGEQPADVIADAVALHLDELAGAAEEIPAAAGIGDGEEPLAATPAREPATGVYDPVLLRESIARPAPSTAQAAIAGDAP